MIIMAPSSIRAVVFIVVQMALAGPMRCACSESRRDDNVDDLCWSCMSSGRRQLCETHCYYHCLEMGLLSFCMFRSIRRVNFPLKSSRRLLSERQSQEKGGERGCDLYSSID